MSLLKYYRSEYQKGLDNGQIEILSMQEVFEWFWLERKLSIWKSRN